jgi:hypothetical protein
MRQALTQQHPAVVLRSTYKQLRALLAIAMVAVVGLTIAVVVLANEDNGPSTSKSSAASTASLRPDGGPEESSVAATVGKAVDVTKAGNYWSPMPRALPDGTTYVPGESAQSDGRPDESRIAGQIETGVQPQTQPQTEQEPNQFSGFRFGSPTD